MKPPTPWTSGVVHLALSALSFSVMTALVKLAEEPIPSQEVIVARAFFSLLASLALLRAAGISPWGTRRKLLMLRGIIGFLALSCVFDHPPAGSMTNPRVPPK